MSEKIGEDWPRPTFPESGKIRGNREIPVQARHPEAINEGELAAEDGGAAEGREERRVVVNAPKDGLAAEIERLIEFVAKEKETAEEMRQHFRRRIKEQEARITFADRLHDRLREVERALADKQDLSVQEVCRRLGLDYYEDKDGRPRIKKPGRLFGFDKRKRGKS